MAAFQPDRRLSGIIDDVVKRAVELLEPERIWLFGSQARGTARRASDADFGFEVPQLGHMNWSRFVLEANDGVPALIDLDLVDLSRCPPQLAREIRETGHVVYVRSDDSVI